jgi:hypothetical protein
MRAIVLEKFGGLDSLVYTDIPKPLPKDGEVVIKVRGFGVNHAEMHMRRGEWAEAAEVSGIECVGIVDACPGGEFPVGAKVAALMGGLGRTINGSYAEYTRVRAANVALIDSELPWSQLAALPETFATAWTCLFRNLKLSAGQTVVIRGATSSFGQAAVKMAVAAGARVIATTRTRKRFAMLEDSVSNVSSWSRGPSPATSRRPSRSMRSSTSSATARSSTRWTCFVATAGPAWRDGWADWIRSETSTRCCAWPAALIGRFSEASCSAPQASRYPMCLCKTSRPRWPTADSKRRRLGSSPSTRSAKHTGSWKPGKPAEKWLSWWNEHPPGNREI